MEVFLAGFIIEYGGISNHVGLPQTKLVLGLVLKVAPTSVDHSLSSQTTALNS
jgi:hypothetical protein